MLVIGFVLAFTTLATASNTYDMCLNLARNNSVIPPQYVSIILATFHSHSKPEETDKTIPSKLALAVNPINLQRHSRRVTSIPRM